VRVFEHLTDGAQRVFVLAQREAGRMHDTSIHSEHLLLGMLLEREGVAGRALSDTGADYHRVRELVEEDDARRAGRQPRTQPFSEVTMRIVVRSLGISWARANGCVDTEDLLVALLEQDDETTEAVLAELDITPQEVVLRIEALLAEWASPVNEVPASPRQ
jgi:ATP-dependent Clp protease ATP-binding subunit ClpA